MDAREEIDALVDAGPRGAGSDAERRAARHLEARLGDLGRETGLEHVDVWPRFQVTHVLHAVLAIVGSVVAVSQPIAGASLALLAVLLTFGDLSGYLPLSRRLTGRRASQNVISREEGGAPGTLVLTAHLDAGRGGALHGPGLRRLAALGPLRLVFWAMLAVLACCIARIPGLEATALTAVQFVPTVVLILALPLLADVALSDVVPGANDNASGVATVLRLGERYGDGALDHFDVWVLFTGAGEPSARGMRAFLRRHRRALDRTRTVLVNVEAVGAGEVRYTRREGLLPGVRSHVQLIQICDDIAEDDEDAGAFGALPIVNRALTDGYAARMAGFPAITVTCRDEEGRAPERVEDDALERAFGFCCELIERLDAELGPDLSEAEDPAPARRRIRVRPG